MKKAWLVYFGRRRRQIEKSENFKNPTHEKALGL